MLNFSEIFLISHSFSFVKDVMDLIEKAYNFKYKKWNRLTILVIINEIFFLTVRKYFSSINNILSSFSKMASKETFLYFCGVLKEYTNVDYVCMCYVD